MSRRPSRRPLPSIVWVVGGIVAILAFIVLIQAAFFGFTQIEGLGSIVILVVAWGSMRLFSAPVTPRKRVIRGRLQPTVTPRKAGATAPPALVAVGILIFATIGFALDQPATASTTSRSR